MSRPPFPPFTRETAAQKARMAEDAWNSRDPERVALAYTEDSRWRNRSEFFEGRAAIVAFLTRKWTTELDYRLIKDLWAFDNNRIAVRFQYEWHDARGTVASLLRQRAVGVRRARPDAPARGLDQRHRDRREGSPLPLAGAGPAACRCAGIGGESVLNCVPGCCAPLRSDALLIGVHAKMGPGSRCIVKTRCTASGTRELATPPPCGARVRPCRARTPRPALSRSPDASSSAPDNPSPRDISRSRSSGSRCSSSARWRDRRPRR